MDQDLILGEPLSKWRRYTPIKASGVIEVYPSDQEMREAYTSIPASHRPLFLMLMYTGNRLSQTADVIAAFDPDEITYTGPNQEIAHISAAAQARGTKKAYRLFFPAAFVPDLIKYKGSPASREGYHTLANRIKHGRISAKTIRKWHLNFMIENGVSESIADYIQGRTAATVGSAHYLNKIKGAVEAYLTLIDKFPVTYKTPIKEAPAPPPAPVITLAVVSPVLCRSL
nr:integrase [Methanocalculus alkaliphilus]